MRGIHLGGALVTSLAGAWVVWGFSLPPAPASGARFFGATPEMIRQVRECGAGEPDRFYEFYFTRAIYSEYGGSGSRGRGYRGGGDWAMDYPKADCQFITVV